MQYYLSQPGSTWSSLATYGPTVGKAALAPGAHQWAAWRNPLPGNVLEFHPKKRSANLVATGTPKKFFGCNPS